MKKEPFVLERHRRGAKLRGDAGAGVAVWGAGAGTALEICVSSFASIREPGVISSTGPVSTNA